MYRQHATTAGVGTLDVNSAEHSPSVQPTRTSNDVVVTYDASRKRRKITSLSTAPLRNVPSIPQATSDAAITRLSRQVEPYADDYSHLLKWQNIADGDRIVHSSDEDELEDENNLRLVDAAEDDTQAIEEQHDDAAEEQHDDAVKETNIRPKLSRDRIIAIINERIEFFTNAWVLNKGVARDREVDYDPETMWNEAEVNGQREGLVHKYEADHKYLRQRLNILCDEILKFPGSNTEQVQRQCSNLEVTVDSMEHAAWLRNIYNLEPVNNTDEDQVMDNQDTATTRDQSDLRQNIPAPQVGSANEIIDLGSPSGSSDVADGNASPFDNDVGVAADLTNQFDARTRSSTRDSIIVDSVEPVVYAHPGLLETGGSLPTRMPVNHGDEPENASIASVRRWNWQDLVEHLDRKRAVSKTIQELKSKDREMIRSRIRNIRKTNLSDEIRACIDMLCKGQTKLQGVLPRDMPKILTFTKLFLSWWFCSNYSQGPEASKKDLEELKECMDDGAAETSTFYDYAYTIMGTTFSEQALQHPDQPSQAEIIEISDEN
ncbi:hypothetical protein G6011_01285 [Alternaria panax]|uniref:DUF7607 domain-containing protein n=1 Tax=Alternaria panax TaxID=48097 RepID=A0AAD4NVS5_9PLEO|nr:hypothetical protein G6011_01285 [Alternaria panax]